MHADRDVVSVRVRQSVGGAAAGVRAAPACRSVDCVVVTGLALGRVSVRTLYYFDRGIDSKNKLT